MSENYVPLVQQLHTHSMTNEQQARIKWLVCVTTTKEIKSTDSFSNIFVVVSWYHPYHFCGRQSFIDHNCQSQKLLANFVTWKQEFRGESQLCTVENLTTNSSVLISWRNYFKLVVSSWTSSFHVWEKRNYDIFCAKKIKDGGMVAVQYVYHGGGGELLHDPNTA